MKWISRFSGWLMCKLGSHDWTCKAIEKIPPTEAEIEPGRKGNLDGFRSYAMMYCKRCGFKSTLTI